MYTPHCVYLTAVMMVVVIAKDDGTVNEHFHSNMAARSSARVLNEYLNNWFVSSLKLL